MLVVALFPMFVAIPQLTWWLKADPLYYTAQVAFDQRAAIQRGVPYADPNNGFQTQALGYRAALDWVSAEVPWWNPYSGVGMPLAAEYQPSALQPLTLLLLLPRGTVILQMVLQILAGLGTYALLRQLGLGSLAATTGGIAYSVNGTLAVLAHGPAIVVPFLPWLVYGIERAVAAAQAGLPGGWRTIAVAMGLSLLGGFPETAYIDGLFALAWALLRGSQLSATGARRRFALRVTAGGLTALALSSPQILAFALYLPDAHVGAHAGDFANAALYPFAWVTALVAPYAVGPIMGYGEKWQLLYFHWGSQGGFVTLALLAMAFHGLVAARNGASILLAAWIVTTICKSLAIEPFLSLWNLVPGVTSAAFARYVQPTWELAVVMLAAQGLDDIDRNGPQRKRLAATAAFAALAFVAAGIHLTTLWPHISTAGGLRNWTYGAFAWAALSTVALLLLIGRGNRFGLRAAAAVLALDAVLMCAIPVASNPRGGRLEMEAVDFLRANLGLQRFFTFGPIQPNYGAYFGIASINHNYLPVPESWVRHVRAHLDRKWTDAVVFNGDAGHNSPEEVRANLRAFEDLGVKYVVMHVAHDYIAGIDGVRVVYAGPSIKIVELANPSPYFQVSGGPCGLEVVERRAARLRCEATAELVRRELYFPGWTATLNGGDTAIARHGEIFQAVALPGGESEVRFRYAPPHIGWAWLACFLALAALAAPLLLRRKN